MGIIFVMMIPWKISGAESVQSNATYLTFEHADGTQSHYELADAPELTFDATKIYIKSAKTETSVDRVNVAHFHFTKGELGAIDNVSADDFTFRFAGNVVTVTGPEIDVLSVYDTAGRCVGIYKAFDGSVSADLDSKADGVYVVSVSGRNAVKVLVKH